MEKEQDSNFAIDRRSFISKSIILFSSILVPACVHNNLRFSGQNEKQDNSGLEDSCIYIEESGGVVGKPVVIGALITNDPKRHLKYLKELRSKHGFQLPLQYKSTNRHKVPFAIDAIKYFVEETDLRFFYDIGDSATTNSYYKDRYKTLIKGFLTSGSNCGVTLTRRTNVRLDGKLADLVGREISGLKKTQSITNAEKNDLSQLSSFLAGSVYGDLGKIKSRSKVVLINELKEKLSVISLRDETLRMSGKFRRIG